ncbi:RNA polymerase sigma factor SigF [Streptomyces sp. B1866]|uniref:RNA polymerase sigma factor SigF n=1 Tax=Streptomyces sp. B1866 TaxID=3075431 RepID=UPI0028904C62|nr:RNA polymerase sigma factor SigF [Streptomyces sp. B1866]MDT3396466.1 RNA polymerase sigma factor SigF [Streptomyces sp. B1866]
MSARTAPKTPLLSDSDSRGSGHGSEGRGGARRDGADGADGGAEGGGQDGGGAHRGGPSGPGGPDRPGAPGGPVGPRPRQTPAARPAPESHQGAAVRSGGAPRPGSGRPGAASGGGRGRGADARALTQVLFAELAALDPGTAEHARVRAALIEANLPLVRYAAARFRSRNEPMEDVIQVGTIGLINAIDRFDPGRGVQFPTFAMPTVVGEIKRYFRDNVRTVHVPRRLHELWVQVSGATEDLTVLHGRSPTTAEIAERLKLSEEEVLACIEAGRSYHATSLEAAQEGDGLPGLVDRLGYEDPALAGVEHRDLVRHLLVQLPEREQRILLLRYYSNLTQSQISAELGVSQMHVSRLLSRSFARLRSANRIES